MNVNSPTTTLTFNASISDDEFTDTVVVVVTATNRYGIGPASEHDVAAISGKVIYN